MTGVASPGGCLTGRSPWRWAGTGRYTKSRRRAWGGDLALGVLPVGGSGNDYVKALGIGTDLGRALEVLAAGKVRVVDAGRSTGSRSTTRSASASTRR